MVKSTTVGRADLLFRGRRPFRAGGIFCPVPFGPSIQGIRCGGNTHTEES